MLSDRSSLDSQYISLTVTHLETCMVGLGVPMCVCVCGGGGGCMCGVHQKGGCQRGGGAGNIYIYINLHSNFFTFYPRVL